MRTASHSRYDGCLIENVTYVTNSIAGRDFCGSQPKHLLQQLRVPVSRLAFESELSDRLQLADLVILCTHTMRQRQEPGAVSDLAWSGEGVLVGTRSVHCCHLGSLAECEERVVPGSS